jgi:hypothetical protein
MSCQVSHDKRFAQNRLPQCISSSSSCWCCDCVTAVGWNAIIRSACRLLCASVCAELRGNSSYLFGLRVAEEARGRGVASKLMVSEPQACGRQLIVRRRHDWPMMWGRHRHKTGS